MRKIKKLCAVILATVLTVLSISAAFTVSAANLSEDEFAKKIAQLRTEYPNGKYWSDNNGVVQSGTYKGTSLVGNKKCSSSLTWSSTCGTFALKGTAKAWQCHGYALLLGHKIFGSNPNNWSKASGSKIYAGDVIRIDVNNNGNNDDYDHTIFVYKVTSSKIYYTDCNWSGPCQIRWNATMSYTALRKVLLYVRRYTGNVLTGSSSSSSTTTVDPIHKDIQYDQIKSAGLPDP